MDQPGQPTKYEPEFAAQAELLCELGATDLKLAKFFEVAKSTVGNWKREHPDFAAAVRSGKDRFDSEKVERSLLRRANGYKFIEVTREACTPKDDEAGTVLSVTKKVTKHIASDVTACIFYLKNRNPERWRDKQEVVHNVNVSLIERIMEGRKLAASQQQDEENGS